MGRSASPGAGVLGDASSLGGVLGLRGVVFKQGCGPENDGVPPPEPRQGGDGRRPRGWARAADAVGASPRRAEK